LDHLVKDSLLPVLRVQQCIQLAWE
jgi:hypothetical protein